MSEVQHVWKDNNEKITENELSKWYVIEIESVNKSKCEFIGLIIRDDDTFSYEFMICIIKPDPNGDPTVMDFKAISKKLIFPADYSLNDFNFRIDYNTETLFITKEDRTKSVQLRSLNESIFYNFN